LLAALPRSAGYLGAVVGLIAVAAVMMLAGGARSARDGVAVPVRSCPTTYAVQGGSLRRAHPASLSANVPAALRGQLVFYSNGYVSLLAPRDGWACSAIVGADGSYGMTLVPVGQRKTDFAHRQISGQFEFNGPGASLACTYFPEALRGFAVGCTNRTPAQERSTRLSRSAVAIEDPPLVTGTLDGSGGQYPTNGVLTFNARRGTAAQEGTCTLPDVQHLVCTTILNDFLSRYAPR
jgi:hypothetical protein